MLVLTRKPGEKIIIADNIVLTVIAVRGRQVRLGFEAPRSIAIKRSELTVRDSKGNPHAT
jgi:carbon storage regulator